MNPKLKNTLEWTYCIVIAIIIALAVKYFIGTPTVVKQKSMDTTLKEGQRLWLNRWTRTTKGEYKVGDIITFEAPSVTYPSLENIDFDNPVAKYDYNPKGLIGKFIYYILETNKTSYIKRIIGVAGDHIKIEDGKVYRNGEQLDEPYLQENIRTESKIYSDIIVPENCVFAMGDNRENSTDCRDFGCIPIRKIESKVAFRFWPLNKFGKIK
jgi:signal peptidase I